MNMNEPIKFDRRVEWARTALLLGMGLYFVYNIVSGNLTNYINVRFAWLSYVAAALFLTLGLASAYRMVRGHSGEHPYQDTTRERASRSWAVMFIVAIPLVLGTLVPSRPLGANAVGGNFNMNAIAHENTTTFRTDPRDRNVLDWVRLFNNSSDLSTFNGQEADVTAFVYRDETFPDDHFLATRFIISCCVADSLAVGVPVAWAEDIPNDTWVRVIGRFEVGDFRGEQKPILQPTHVEVVDQPEHPYLYP